MRKTVVVWGTGTPRREFLYVDDMADACVHLMKTYSGAELINIGTDEDITIAEFTRVVAEVVGYRGEISFDTPRLDGRASCSTSAVSPSSAGAHRPLSGRGFRIPLRRIKVYGRRVASLEPRS